MASSGKNSGGRGGAGEDGFYGIKHYGNTLFIVDVSGSMSAKTRECISRIDIMRSQLRNAIRSAARKKEKKKYSIITFASEINRFPNKGKRQTYFDNIDTQKDAEIFIQKMSPNGGSYMMAAWKEAIRLVHNNEVKIDTIFFLSDGEPSDCNGSDLIKFIQEHVSKEITINTIAIGLSSSFMEELAKIYSGTYLCVE